MPARSSGLDRSLTIQLLRTRESLMAHFRPMLQSLGVTEQQWRVLRCLYPDHSLEAAQLAHDAAILPPSLTRILKTLEKSGLVESQRPDSDRRRLTVRLSAKGLTFMEAAVPESRRIYAEIRQAIGEVRMEYLYDLLAETMRVCDELTISPAEEQTMEKLGSS